MTISTYVKYGIVALGLAGAAYFAHALYKAGATGAELEAAHAQVERIQASAAAGAVLQKKVDHANSRLRSLEADRSAVAERLVAAERVLLEATPDRAEYAASTVAALRDYAASLDADFAECRAEHRALGFEAAAASDAAHALASAWPEPADISAHITAVQGLK